jgi:RNA polymerase sigma factor (TIGR02999 family)
MKLAVLTPSSGKIRHVKTAVGDHFVTELLIDWGKGDQSALDRLMPLVYSELCQVARNQLRFENPGHTLPPTAVVHETYLRLVDQRRVEWRNRAQFFAISAQLVRRVLADHARHRQAAKRGGNATRVQLDDAIGFSGPDLVDAITLDHALEELANLDGQQARVVELRFYAGLSIEETAAALGTSEATVSRDWVTAKAWLYRRLSGTLAMMKAGT